MSGEGGVCCGCSEESLSSSLSLSDGCDLVGFSIASSSKSDFSGFDNGLLLSSLGSITSLTDSDSLGKDVVGFVVGSILGFIGSKLSCFGFVSNPSKDEDGSSFCGVGILDFSESSTFLSSDWGVAIGGKGSGLFSGC